MRGERLRSVTVPAAALVVLAGSATAGAHGNGDYLLEARGQFGLPGERSAAAALTYDARLVPPGARVEVRQHTAGSHTEVKLAVSGVRPGHTYGAHVHALPCAADPAASGPHYQHVPGDDPALANPENEVWLDFTADAAGSGWASARQHWSFRPGEAASVVLHEHATATGEGGQPPGHAGGRVACFTVPFVPAAPGHGAVQ
jgi:Cu-Zn family superoxide dismutase